MQLIASPDLRRRMANQVANPLARHIWNLSLQMKDQAFYEEIESTVNRLGRFVGTDVIRASLCQDGTSLDLTKALDEGHIVLACLSTEKTRIDDEDAAAFGSLLLNDLWTAVRWRGKHDDPKPKPFYLYADEFQNYVTPMMGRALSEARGYGLHMTLAHQYPSQLLEKSTHGKGVFNSVMANARTKVVFQIDHPEDLPLLTEWLFRTSVDTDQIKYQGYSTKVVDHELTYVPTYGHSTSTGHTVGRQWSHTDGESHDVSDQWSHTDGEGLTASTESSHADNRSSTTGRSRTRTDGRSREEGTSADESSGETESDTGHWQTSHGSSRNRSRTDTDGRGESVGLSGQLDIDFEDKDMTFEEEFLKASLMRSLRGIAIFVQSYLLGPI